MSEEKIRQLAKELRLPASGIVDWLRAHGEPVESTASPLAPAAEKRLRELFGGKVESGDQEGSEPTLVAELCRDYREAYMAERQTVEIRGVYKKYRESSGIAFSMARAIVAEDKKRNPELYQAARADRACKLAVQIRKSFRATKTAHRDTRDQAARLGGTHEPSWPVKVQFKGAFQCPAVTQGADQW